MSNDLQSPIIGPSGNNRDGFFKLLFNEEWFAPNFWETKKRRFPRKKKKLLKKQGWVNGYIIKPSSLTKL
jgi:hypothetical protein